MKTYYQQRLTIVGCMLFFGLLCSGCATQQGYQGAAVGALTGATAGILLDPDNRWRGGVIGGGLGSVLGGTLTYRPVPRQQYAGTYYSGYQQNFQSQNNYTTRGALIGGAAGATTGALLDHDNGWRGGLIGGTLGSFFGGAIGHINSGPSIPVLAP